MMNKHSRLLITKCCFSIGYSIGRKYQPIWVSDLDLNQYSGFGHPLLTLFVCNMLCLDNNQTSNCLVCTMYCKNFFADSLLLVVRSLVKSAVLLLCLYYCMYFSKHDLLPFLTYRTCNSATQKPSATAIPRNLLFWWLQLATATLS